MPAVYHHVHSTSSLGQKGTCLERKERGGGERKMIAMSRHTFSA